MLEQVLEDHGRGHGTVGPDHAGPTVEAHSGRYALAGTTFEWLSEVPESDHFSDLMGPEKALAIYLVALWQIVNWSDVAECWARARPSRRPGSPQRSAVGAK